MMDLAIPFKAKELLATGLEYHFNADQCIFGLRQRTVIGWWFGTGSSECSEAKKESNGLERAC